MIGSGCDEKSAVLAVGVVAAAVVEEGGDTAAAF